MVSKNVDLDYTSVGKKRSQKGEIKYDCFAEISS